MRFQIDRNIASANILMIWHNKNFIINCEIQNNSYCMKIVEKVSEISETFEMNRCFVGSPHYMIDFGYLSNLLTIHSSNDYSVNYDACLKIISLKILDCISFVSDYTCVFFLFNDIFYSKKVLEQVFDPKMILDKEVPYRTKKQRRSVLKF